jgi:hypothetical protein
VALSARAHGRLHACTSTRWTRWRSPSGSGRGEEDISAPTLASHGAPPRLCGGNRFDAAVSPSRSESHRPWASATAAVSEVKRCHGPLSPSRSGCRPQAAGQQCGQSPRRGSSTGAGGVQTVIQPTPAAAQRGLLLPWRFRSQTSDRSAQKSRFCAGSTSLARGLGAWRWVRSSYMYRTTRIPS